MANAVRRSEATGDALLLTEYLDLGFGFQTAMIESFASRQFWAWRAYDCCYREYGVIQRLGEPPTPDNLDQNLLDLIVQPYSRAIAGTPIAASYAFEDKRYALEYSPVPITGGSPPDTGWRTEIFVPQRHYPLGYVVEVTNGTVVSEKDAPLLIVQAVSMAERVSVTVTPR
jgi:endoglycosylceramidase